MADTRVEVLVLHRDDVVSVIASGSAPTSTFQVACRVESCMFPSDEVILRRLTDEYNWYVGKLLLLVRLLVVPTQRLVAVWPRRKLYKYSLLQESLVKKDMSRPRELRRIHPGVLPKAASAARQCVSCLPLACHVLRVRAHSVPGLPLQVPPPVLESTQQARSSPEDSPQPAAWHAEVASQQRGACRRAHRQRVRHTRQQDAVAAPSGRGARPPCWPDAAGFTGVRHRRVRQRGRGVVRRAHGGERLRWSPADRACSTPWRSRVRPGYVHAVTAAAQER